MSPPIIIAGAGIGGLSAALALAQQGLQCHLVERAPEITEVGAGLQLGPNGFRAFERLGIEREMDAVSFRPDAIRLIDSIDGAELSRQTLGEVFERRFGHPYRVGYRADVQSVLLEAVRRHADRITITLGDAVRAIADHGDAVTVTLESGRKIGGAGLIGADGLWSQVREHLFGAAPPRSSGHIAYRAVLPVERLPIDLATNDVQLWIGPGHHLVCYKMRGGAIFNIVAIIHGARDVRGWDMVGDSAELRSGFADACEPVQRIISLVEQGRIWALSDRDPTPGWSRGRITLLGDAAHPMLPYLAQGACMAVEDAVSLADAVAADPHNLSAAFGAYEAGRFARTASVQRAARETGMINHASGIERERRNAFLATRRDDDYEAIAWLFGSDGPRPGNSPDAEIGIFGRHRGEDHGSRKVQ
ncbi:FAD-dependent monooxygenase [Sphingobium sp. EM0848]|uniref:FAD-dependent monooxygenase n=1 Tax=Sphingobium sp. EM0848 TaxID=2743473 RepID=UPI00159C2A4E|nr:FAD-dependent monooxygenase [Sphingobium sp. EM0848]